MTKEKYHQYLLSDKWQSVRSIVLRRAGGKCSHCASHAMLNVHHLTYKNIGHEKPSELMVLCRRCHELVEAVIFATERPRSNTSGLRRYVHNTLTRHGIRAVDEQRKPRGMRKSQWRKNQAVAADRREAVLAEFR